MEWVVIANTNQCRIFQLTQHPQVITLIKEISHPENRIKNEDYLTSDKQGRYVANDSAHGAYQPHMDPKEVEVDKFAREIARALNLARNENAYEKLMIVTPPYMMGLLSQHLDKHVKSLVVKEIQKDAIHLAQHEILPFLKTHT